MLEPLIVKLELAVTVPLFVNVPLVVSAFAMIIPLLVNVPQFIESAVNVVALACVCGPAALNVSVDAAVSV